MMTERVVRFVMLVPIEPGRKRLRIDEYARSVDCRSSQREREFAVFSKPRRNRLSVPLLFDGRRSPRFVVRRTSVTATTKEPLRKPHTNGVLLLMPAKSSPAANLNGYGTFVLVTSAGLVVMILAVASRDVWSQEYDIPLAPIPEQQVWRSPPETLPSAERHSFPEPVNYQTAASHTKFVQPTIPSADLIPQDSPPARQCTACSSRYRNTQVVERATGIPGVRVSEWRSSATGLTLSEEQQFGAKTNAIPVSGNECQPCDQRPLPSVKMGRPYLNIPDSVW